MSNNYNPTWFGLTGEPIKYSTYLKKLKQGANNHEQGYLPLLISYVESKGRIPPNQKKLFDDAFSASRNELNDINKNFGESVGPLAILHMGLFGAINPSSYMIHFPSEQNLPLLDYKISKNGGKNWYSISAKAKTGKTNTVKPSSIIESFDGSVPDDAKVAYQFVKMIHEGSTNEGSQEALEFLKKKYPSQVKPLLPKQYHNSRVNSKVLAESVFETMSKNKNSVFSKQLNTLFWSALQNLNVHYIKFGINSSTGYPEFDRVSDKLDVELNDGNVKKISNPEDYQPFVYFRGKGREAGVKRAEKPGFQL